MLNARQIRHLRALAHGLDPVVRVGQQGVTPAVLAELDAALEAHELVKVKISASDRRERQARVEQLASGCGAEIVQTIGHTVTLFRTSARRPRSLLAADP